MTVYKEPLLDRLEHKFGKYSIRNLMKYIVIGMAAVWLIDYIALPLGHGYGFASKWLSFDRGLILKGQIWRVLTFIFIPTGGNILLVAIQLYFYWSIGTALANNWGNFQFDLFYLCGVLGAIAAGFITGTASNSYLNMSIFLAFAISFPNMQFIMLFIPVKAKWMALLSLAGIVLSFITDSWLGRLSLVMSLINIVIFFHRDAVNAVKDAVRRYKWKKNWK